MEPVDPDVVPVEAGFTGLTAGAVALAVDVLVFNRVVDSLPLSGGGAVDFSALLPSIQSAFGLAPVALLVLVAGLILRQLTVVQ